MANKTKVMQNSLSKKKGAISYSQSGEDMILAFIFKSLTMPQIQYLDIGAYDPVELSNTYYFYQHGSSGVCIEPNYQLFKKFRQKRQRDICLNVGIGPKKGIARLYVREFAALSGFTKKKSQLKNGKQNKDLEVTSTNKVQVLTINEVIDKYFTKSPNLISIDTEGFDYQILKSFDFNKYRPEVFCIETITYSANLKGKKVKKIIDLMHSRGYFHYGDTFINSIFVDKNAWKINE
jgi:FkbM family methyltransferase